jgi:predicted metal-dependent hydrolase
LLGNPTLQEAHQQQGGVIVAEHSPPINNNGPQEQTPAPQDVDVILDVSELEVDRIKLTVKDLSAHVSVLAELASLLNLQVGVHARLDEVELEIEGVRAKVLLKVRLDDIRAILKEALETVAQHPEILRILTRALDELVTGRVEDALGTVENVLGGLEDDGTVDELLKGRLEDVRDTLQEVLSQVGEQAQEGGLPRQGLPRGPSSSAAELPGGDLPKGE